MSLEYEPSSRCHPNCASEALEPEHFVPSVAFCLANNKTARPRYTDDFCRGLPPVEEK